jgi:hypothetical protein
MYGRRRWTKLPLPYSGISVAHVATGTTRRTGAAMSEVIAVLEAVASEALHRMRLAQVALDLAQARYDTAAETYKRACDALGAAIKAADKETP